MSTKSTTRKHLHPEVVNPTTLTPDQWMDMYEQAMEEIANHSADNIKNGMDPLVLSGVRFYYTQPTDKLQMEYHQLTCKLGGVDSIPCLCNNNDDEIPDTIEVGVYHTTDDNGNVVFDVEEMTREFKATLNRLITNNN